MKRCCTTRAGAEHVAAFARACRSAVLVHVSTAFVAGRRTGLIAEAALPDIAAAEIAAIEEMTRSIDDEGRRDRISERERRAQLVKAGMTRPEPRLARHLHLHESARRDDDRRASRRRANGHRAADDHRKQLARSRAGLAREPQRRATRSSSSTAAGGCRTFPLRRDTVFDIVPVDLVANAVVALLPHVGGTEAIGYYAIGSGALNPLTGARLYEYGREHFLQQPMLDRRGRPIPAAQWTFPTPERFREMLAGDGRPSGRQSTTRKRLLYLADLYEGYTNADCVFDTANTDRLLGRLHDRDRALLDFDVRRIDWRSYIQDVHIPGLAPSRPEGGRAQRRGGPWLTTPTASAPVGLRRHAPRARRPAIGRA